MHARSRSSCASRHRCCAWSAASSSAARGMASCVPMPESTPRIRVRRTPSRCSPKTPMRPPARSARRLPALLGIGDADAPAVIVSDSFGRPWRFGIVDVALGVAGIAPLVDMRGEPDADGRTMRSTVVALADEICSAAELAAGKTSRQPVVLVRGVVRLCARGFRPGATWSCRGRWTSFASRLQLR